MRRKAWAVPRRSSVRAAGVAVAVAVSLGLASACTGGGSKPGHAVAGCDLPQVSSPDIPVERIIAQELYSEHLVTGEPRSSTFNAIFSGGRVHDQNALAAWFTVHENDADLLISNRTPGEWDSHLAIDVFPAAYSAYRAYCTGWSFRDYASTHWNQVLVSVRPAVTLSSASP